MLYSILAGEPTSFFQERHHCLRQDIMTDRHGSIDQQLQSTICHVRHKPVDKSVIITTEFRNHYDRLEVRNRKVLDIFFTTIMC